VTLYSCAVGSSWVLVNAHNADNAREQLGIRLGYEHKPWLWRDIVVRRATAEDVTHYGAIVDSTLKPGASPAKRPHTAALLAQLAPEPDPTEDDE
jgi:hypothetical protein